MVIKANKLSLPKIIVYLQNRDMSIDRTQRQNDPPLLIHGKHMYAHDETTVDKQGQIVAFYHQQPGGLCLKT